MNKFDICSASVSELSAFVERLGEPKYRAIQIFEWIHGKFAEDFSSMTNLSLALREKLMQNAFFSLAKIADCKISKDFSTKKYLFELENNIIIDDIETKETVFVEAVVMEYKYGLSVCISSQAGCRMGCDFCASGIHGLQRSLTAGEMAAQLYAVSRDMGRRISNIVLMGSGEPLDNFDNVMKFLELANSEKGAGIGMKHITLSTVGLVPKIYDLLEKKLRLTLAVSLHAPNDEIRRRLIPAAKAYDMESLLAACRAYSEHRRVTFEYIMIHGINDSAENALELSGLIKGMNCHINLIPANGVEEKGYIKSTEEDLQRFADILESRGISTTIRRGMGGDINAACGQLRAKRLKIADDI